MPNVKSGAVLTALSMLMVVPGAMAGSLQLGGGWQADTGDNDVNILVDAVTQDYVLIQVQKDFTEPPVGGLFPPIDIEFTQIGDDADTSPMIVIADEDVTNLTGVPWTDYHWELIDPEGAVWYNLALSSHFSIHPFTNSMFGDFLDAPANTMPTSLMADGGVVMPGASFFPGGAAGNGELAIEADLTGDPVSFTFRQFPTPEPTALLLLGLGAVLVRRRARLSIQNGTRIMLTIAIITGLALLAGPAQTAQAQCVADCPAGTVALLDGEGDFSGWCAAVSQPANIQVNVHDVDLTTGVMDLSIQKQFTEPPSFGGVWTGLIIDVVQACPDAETVTMVRLMEEAILNHTGSDWDDFHWNIYAIDEAWIDVAASSDFDTAPLVVAEFGDFIDPPANTQAKAITASGGVVPNGSTYTPGAGPGMVKINIDLSGDLAVSWSIKERPTCTPPMIECRDLTVECDGMGNLDDLHVWLTGSAYVRYSVTPQTLIPWDLINSPAPGTSTQNYGWVIDGDTSYHQLGTGGNTRITKIVGWNSGAPVATELMSVGDWFAATGKTTLTAFYGFVQSGDYLVFGDSSTDAVWRVDKTTGAVTSYASSATILAHQQIAHPDQTSVALLTSKTLAPNGEYTFFESRGDDILITTGLESVATLVSKDDLIAVSGNNTVSGGLGYDNADSLYWGSNTSDSMYKRASDGTLSVVLTKEEILAATGKTAAGFADINGRSPDGMVYFYESNADSIYRFDPADPPATLMLVVSDLELASAPNGNDIVYEIGFHNGMLAYNNNGDRDVYVVPDPPAGCGGLDVTDDFSGVSDDCGATGSATVTFTVTDSAGNSDSSTCTFTIEDTTPPEVECSAAVLSCCEEGKPRALTMKYTGEDCSATSSLQDAGKVSCTGDPGLATPVRILATDKADPLDGGARVYFDGPVDLNGDFTIDAASVGDSSLQTATFVHVLDASNNVLQTVEFHTSCSQPLFVGNQFGSVLLIDCIGEYTPIPGDCCDEGDPSVLTMQYTGEGCVLNHVQDADKVSCSGDTMMTDPVFIRASDKVDPYDDSAKVWFEGQVALNGTYDIAAANAGQTKLTTATFVHVFDLSDNLLQTIEFHTSCSQPLFVGNQFGSALMVDCIGEHALLGTSPPVLLVSDCMTGPTPAACPDGCNVFDMDLDGDIDLADYSLMQVIAGTGDPITIQFEASDICGPVTTEAIVDLANCGVIVVENLDTIQLECAPTTDNCCANGDPRLLTMQYTGEDCLATSSGQDADKVSCTGDPAMTDPVRILATDKPDPLDTSAKVWFDGQVALNSTFDVNALNAGETKLKTATFIYVYDLSDNLLQSIEFHTSCSQPLFQGDQFGSALLVDCTGDAEPIPDDCCNESDVVQLTAQYTGEGCILSTTQDPSKVNCSGDAMMTDPVRILATDKDDPNDASAKVWFDGQVALNNTFDIDALAAGEDKLKNATFIYVYDLSDNLLQSIEFHTSCSEPLFVGDQFGSLLLTDCPNSCLPDSATLIVTATDDCGLVSTCTEDLCAILEFNNYVCTGPINELTMIWAGMQDVRIVAYMGAVGSTVLADIDNIVPGDAVTVSGFAGSSSNDVYWEVFEAGTSTLIGESVFHISCSDDDMNGSEDCGKRQGNGKSTDPTLINDWLLQGMVDAGGTLDCSYAP
jgi:hypothetical protein